MHLLSASGAAVFLEYTFAVHGDCWVPEEGENGPDSVLPPQVCLHYCTVGAAHSQQKMQGESLHQRVAQLLKLLQWDDDSSRQKRQGEQHNQKEQFLVAAGLLN